MNRSGAIAGVGVGVVAAYVGASWFCGHAVNSSFETWQQKNQARLPPFVTLEHQYTPGVFHSTHLTTIRIDSASLEKLWPALRGIKTAAHVSPGSAGAIPVDAHPDINDANPAAPIQSLVVTIRHDVSHGPFPGFNSLGLARVQTHFILSDEARQKLNKVIGNQEPISVVTQLKLNGGGVSDITSPAFNVTENNETLNWRGVQGQFVFGPHSDAVQGVLKAPGLTAVSDKGKLEVGELAMQFDLNRIVDDIYGGTTTLTAAGFDGTFNDAGVSKHYKAEKLQYDGVITRTGDYFDMAAKMDLGRLDAADVVLTDAAYHLTVKHLHTQTYSSMMQKLQGFSYANARDPAAQAAMKSAFQEFVPTLLEHNPELVIDRIAVTFPEGTASLSGSVKLPGFTHEDMNGMRALSKLEAVADLSVAQALIEKDWSAKQTQDATAESSAAARMTALRAQTAQMQQQGFIVLREGQYQSHVEFKQGHLAVNGKALR